MPDHPTPPPPVSAGQLLCSKCTAEATHAFDFALYRAAPALLAACEALVAEADRTGGRERTVSRYEVDRARSALAAARGERGAT